MKEIKLVNEYNICEYITLVELKAEQDKIVKFQTFDSSYFCGKLILKMMEL